MLTLAVLVGVTIYALSSTADVTETTPVDNPTVASPALPEPVKDPIAKADEKVPPAKLAGETVVNEANTAVDVATKPAAVEAPAKTPAVETPEKTADNTAEKTPVNVAPKDVKVASSKDTASKTTKKVVKKVEAAVAPTKPADKPVEEPKEIKPAPAKFAPVDTRKW
ncbi:MAG: hypothetical protein R3E66_04005 [bacterium]